jgi:hypothetical protein
MKQLAYLHHRLARLRRRRQRFRQATAASAVAIAVLAVLGAVFALDWCFQQNEDLWQRLFLLAVGAVAVVWATRRYALPWLGKREDQLEMALLVQRHAGIDSDLVAALQFESPEAPQWGSAQLETAVIEKVALRQEGLDVMAALPCQPLAGRLKVLAAVVALWVLVGLFFPQHVRVFFNRLLLGAQHYPSQTQIVALSVNGKNVHFSSPQEAAVHVSYGRPVSFEVKATGLRPTGGRVELAGTGPGKAAVVALEPSSGGQEDESCAVFQGRYPRLIQPARYQVYLGDAWTDPLVLDVTPLPIVEVEPEVVPPLYARHNGQEVQKLPRGTGQFAVIEGSEVRLRVHSDRPLKSVALTVGEKPIAPVRRQAESSEEGETWAPKTVGTPLAAVTEPLRYSIQVTDAEDQQLERPVEGFIRIEPDLPPRVAAATKTPFILPAAQPTIYFGATDDHAVGRIWLTWEVLRDGASAAAEAPQEQIDIYRSADAAKLQATQEGAYAFDLGSLHLSRGDTLRVTLHASDYRGQREGKTAHAEPLVFQVTDEQGIISSMLEGDQKSARELESIIKNLLGIAGGDSP